MVRDVQNKAHFGKDCSVLATVFRGNGYLRLHRCQRYAALLINVTDLDFRADVAFSNETVTGATDWTLLISNLVANLVCPGLQAQGPLSSSVALRHCSRKFT